MPSQSTSFYFDKEHIGIDMATQPGVVWYCIYNQHTKEPYAIWSDEVHGWVSFDTGERMPEFDHIDPRKVESGQGIAFKEHDGGT